MRTCPDLVRHTELGGCHGRRSHGLDGVFGLMHAGEELGTELMLHHHGYKDGGQEVSASLGSGGEVEPMIFLVLCGINQGCICCNSVKRSG